MSVRGPPKTSFFHICESIQQSKYNMWVILPITGQTSGNDWTCDFFKYRSGRGGLLLLALHWAFLPFKSISTCWITFDRWHQSLHLLECCDKCRRNEQNCAGNHTISNFRQLFLDVLGNLSCQASSLSPCISGITGSLEEDSNHGRGQLPTPIIVCRSAMKGLQMRWFNPLLYVNSQF